MSSVQRRWTALWVPAVALVAVLASGAYLFTQQSDFHDGRFGWGNSNSDTWRGPDGGGHGSGWGMGPGRGDGTMIGGSGSGSGYGRLRGDGSSVKNLAQARDRASVYAKTLEPDLTAGEVMEFSNQYYAELQERDDAKATEVLIDPENGSVQLEFGPTGMWNTRFGMMSGDNDTSSKVTASRALQIANKWLASRDDGLSAETADAFPGYYTLHTLKDGKIEGMLSVNSSTGDVRYHSWHGDFKGMSESP